MVFARIWYNIVNINLTMDKKYNLRWCYAYALMGIVLEIKKKIIDNKFLKHLI